MELWQNCIPRNQNSSSFFVSRLIFRCINEMKATTRISCLTFIFGWELMLKNCHLYIYIECAIWETLNKAQFGDEKLAQGEYDGSSKDGEVFYTPLKSLDKEGNSFTTLPNIKINSKVDSHIHSIIVKQFTKLNIVSRSQKFAINNSIAKCIVLGSQNFANDKSTTKCHEINQRNDTNDHFLQTNYSNL